MKNYRKKAKEAVHIASDIARDIVGNIPKITVNSGKEVVIDGKCRIIEYGSEKISAVCGRMKINILGRALNVGLLDKCALVVRGVVTGVYFEE